MLRFVSAVMTNPVTGDHSDATLKVFIIAGAVCVVAVVALLVIPKLSKKKNTDESEIEEINEE